MDTQLTRAAGAQLARSVRRRYQAASSRAKKQILDEFIAVSGYHPKYAIHVLNAPEYMLLQQTLEKLHAMKLFGLAMLTSVVPVQGFRGLWQAMQRREARDRHHRLGLPAPIS